MVGIELIIGHLIGDYLLQNDWMAKNKVNNTVDGYWACFVHCFIYSTTIALFVTQCGWATSFSFLEPQIGSTTFHVAFLIAFLSHYPIDKFSLGKKWMKLFGHSLDGPFAPCVYIGVDNGAHLALMMLGFSILGT